MTQTKNEIIEDYMHSSKEWANTASAMDMLREHFELYPRYQNQQYVFSIIRARDIIERRKLYLKGVYNYWNKMTRKQLLEER